MKQVYFIKHYIINSDNEQLTPDVYMDFAETEERIEKRLKTYKIIEESSKDVDHVHYFDSYYTEYGSYIGAFVCVNRKNGERVFYSVDRRDLLQ